MEKILIIFLLIILLLLSIKDLFNTTKALKIDVKYFNGAKKLKKIEKGDWIDLSANETIALKKGEFKLIPLGVAMKLPDGYEANIVPRSSMYKNFKV